MVKVSVRLLVRGSDFGWNCASGFLFGVRVLVGILVSGWGFGFGWGFLLGLCIQVCLFICFLFIIPNKPENKSRLLFGCLFVVFISQ